MATKELDRAIQTTVYTLEIMDRKNYEYKDVLQVDISACTIKIDYLKPTPFPIQIKGRKDIQADIYDWIKISRGTRTIFRGYIQSIALTDTGTTLQVCYPLKLFDNPDMTRHASITDYQSWIMQHLYSSYLMTSNVPIVTYINASFTGQSSTIWDSLVRDIPAGEAINDMQMIQDVRRNHGGFLGFYFNRAAAVPNRLNRYFLPLTGETMSLDAGMINVHKAQVKVTSKTGQNVAEIMSYDADNTTTHFYTMTLLDDGTISTADADKIRVEIPRVSVKVVDYDKYPESYPYDELYKMLSPSEDNVEIRLTYGLQDMIAGLSAWIPDTPNARGYYIGRPAEIKYNGKIYKTYLTGVEFDKNEITWIFGFVRPELTKAISK